ncbi:hypothetical protein ACHAQA_009238 [Verticillium albo-atrum]
MATNTAGGIALDAALDLKPAQTTPNGIQTATNPPSAPALRILPGYRPGFLARCLDMHMTYYHDITGWGLAFETTLARDFGDILTRLDANPASQVWSALGPDDRILGTVLLDADAGAKSGAQDGASLNRVAQLRGFIVDPAARGLGAGRAMLEAVMAHVRAVGVEEVVLYTMGSLETAVHLYRSAGFVVESVHEQVVWERSIPQMRLVWRAHGANPKDIVPGDADGDVARQAGVTQLPEGSVSA